MIRFIFTPAFPYFNSQILIDLQPLFRHGVVYHGPNKNTEMEETL